MASWEKVGTLKSELFSPLSQIQEYNCYLWQMNVHLLLIIFPKGVRNNLNSVVKITSMTSYMVLLQNKLFVHVSRKVLIFW